jgi:hypothetical protein
MNAKRAFRPAVVENTLEARVALSVGNPANPIVIFNPIGQTPRGGLRGPLLSSVNPPVMPTNPVGTTPIAGGGSVRGGDGITTINPLTGPPDLPNPRVLFNPIGQTPRGGLRGPLLSGL